MKKINMRLWMSVLVSSWFWLNTSAYASIATDAQLSGQTLTISTTDGVVSIKALTRQSVYVWYQPNQVRQLPSFALDPNLQDRINTSLVSDENGWLFKLPDLTVKVQRDPVRLSYWQGDKLILTEEVGLINQATMKGFRFALTPDEKIMGGGQRVLGMDRRGHRMPLYNRAHYGYTTESNQMYYGLSAVMSSNLYAIVFDNSASGFLDIGHTQTDILQFEAVAGRTAYIFSAAKHYADLVSEITHVTGRQPLPPRWALGNFASRFGYRTAQETLDTISAFKQQDIPVDAIVLDLYWFGPDIKGHMGNLEWDRDAWPEPENMIAELRDHGVKTVLITEPFILTTSTQWQSAVDNQALAKDFSGKPKRFDFYFGNTGLVDVFDANAQDWFWRYYDALADQGVAGWWGDLGEPEVHPADSLHFVDGKVATGDEIHNAYGHQWAKMVYERQLSRAPDLRPFVMMRSGFAGSQRYGMIPWTGDVSREWGGLQSQVELALQMGLFGLAYTHSDLGGFAGGETFDPELYTRWLQFGVFTPVFRPHAQEHIAPEPVFHADPVKQHAREFIKLRYALMPYIYSMAYQNSLSGVPIMRPLFMDYPDMPIEHTQSYLFGENLLVQPVVDAGVTQQSVLLPSGHWYHYWTDALSKGGQSVHVDTPINQMPVFVKAGGFVPMVEPVSSLDDYSTSTLAIHYYLDPAKQTSRYIMYDDDGKSANAIAQQKFEKLSMQASFTDGLLLNLVSEGDFAGKPASRTVTWHIHGVNKSPSIIWIDGQRFDVEQSENMTWDQHSKQLMIKTPFARQLALRIEL
ncbi:TIM-barrel domain-containing protein [Alteromonas facilis]|uniref:TIM-barrel domain-containing protein n=1 Tax=Alteromonas facilis TaxID=2048004 RepID=UPI000C2925BD|nr:TIM-barrel domain-containing protein [Alteromonas facilis]